MTRRLALMAVIMSLAIPAIAHHSGVGRYDPNATMELDGEIAKITWRNPHIYINLTTSDASGDLVTWIVEGGSPNRLRRSGIERDVIRPGDRVRIAGWPPVTERKELFVSNLLTPAGEELLFLPYATPRWTGAAKGDRSYLQLSEGDPSQPELGIFRVWTYTTKSPILYPGSAIFNDFDVFTYPLTESAKTAVRGYNGETDNPTLNCRPKGMPLIMEQPFPMEFVEDGDNILVRIEEYDQVRTIYMNPSAANAERSGSLLGYSVGRWEGNTLLVTTTDINWGWFNQLGVPQSEKSVILERFRVAEDGSRLDYEVTITDPINFTEPVVREKFWLYVPGVLVEPFDCSTEA